MNTQPYQKIVQDLELAAGQEELGNSFTRAEALRRAIQGAVALYVQAQTKKGADGRTDQDLAPVLFTREQAAAVLKDLYLGPGKAPVGAAMEIERGLGNLDQE